MKAELKTISMQNIELKSVIVEKDTSVQNVIVVENTARELALLKVEHNLAQEKTTHLEKQARHHNSIVQAIEERVKRRDVTI